MKKHIHPLARLVLVAAAVASTGAALTSNAWADKPDSERHERGRGAEQRYEDRRGDDRRGDDRRLDDRRAEYRRGDEQDDRRAHARYGDRAYYERRPMVELRFSDHDRRFIHDYYGAQWQRGKCPPGLAKKNNGCLPPGQAKVWQMGQPLAYGVQRYPLPPEVLIRLPIPPAGHEFVRVASDILLIAVGSGMVIDAIQDLGR